VNLRFGLDLVPIASVAQRVADGGSGYVDRTYTAAEIADSRRAGGVDSRRLAERFAVKEATRKVLPLIDDGIDSLAIELVCDARGRLGVALHGHAAEIATAAGIGRLAVSVTGDDRLAAAVVVAEIDGTDERNEGAATTR
jgi:phosphopantetheine--protein transferase-like protein